MSLNCGQQRNFFFVFWLARRKLHSSKLFARFNLLTPLKHLLASWFGEEKGKKGTL